MCVTVPAVLDVFTQASFVVILMCVMSFVGVCVVFKLCVWVMMLVCVVAGVANGTAVVAALCARAGVCVTEISAGGVV